MIYMDSAATSLLKPAAVGRAVAAAVNQCASPGRGSHAAAARAADIALSCREEAARLLGAAEPEQVVFTLNATHALNIAVRSVVRPGMHVLISGYEHNAVLRPLRAIGAEIRTAAAPPFDTSAMLAAFQKELNWAEAVVCCHVSNVFGCILPVEELAALCRGHGLPLIVDASQSAGVLPIDFSVLGCAFLACPGHKGLLGPQGTGLLLCGSVPEPLLFGGTGSNSAAEEMPDFLPDRLEAGTHNIPGIAGLLEGIRWVNAVGIEQIRRTEDQLLALLAGELAGETGLRLFYAADRRRQCSVLSVETEQSCEMLAERLGERGVAVRAGLHCAPLAHHTAGTGRHGTLRFSVSPLLGRGELEAGVRIFREVLHGGE